MSLARRLIQWPWSPPQSPKSEGNSTGNGFQVLPRKRRARNKKLQNTDIIKGIMLCLWDNVSGPRTEQIWEGEEPLCTEMLKYICRYTLGGEITHSTLSSEKTDPKGGLISKFNLLPQYDFIVSCVVFEGKYYNGISSVSESNTKWAFCIFVQRCFLQRYIKLHRIFEEELHLIASILQHQLNTKIPSESIQAISHRIELFVKFMTILTKNEAPKWNIDSTFLGEAKSPFPKEFLNFAITSHLRSGSSVVVGAVEDIERINMMINTLMMFTPREQHALCSHVREDYIPGLILQGKTGDFDRLITIHSIYPSTVIEIAPGKMSVHLMNVKHHSKARDVLNQFYIESTEKSQDSLPDLLKEEFLFKSMKETSPFVNTLFNEISPLPSPLRVPIILHFRKFLERRSIVLIRFAEAPDDTSGPRSGLKKRVKDLFNANEVDFAIILALAESISPGVSVKVYGTTQDELEKRFNDLWGVG